MNDFFFSLMILGAASTGSQMPFWSYSNQYDLMPRTSGYATIVNAGMEYDDSHVFQYHWGTTLALRGDTYDMTSFVPGQAYAGVKWHKLSLDLGLKNTEQRYFGADKSLGSLSSTAGNIIMSGNARNMPGYTLNLDPFDIPFTGGHLKIFGKYGDYYMTDARIEGKTLVHNTQAYLQGLFGNWTAGLGLEHWAQWNGGPFSDYLRVITGSHAGSGDKMGNIVNVIGNQLGRETFFVSYKGEGWSAELRHDVPFEDKSGLRFGNFPDGVNYLSFSFDDKDKWVSDVVYEYQYTMYQSGSEHEAEFDEDGNHIPWEPGKKYFGNDNYFNNWEFKTGWTNYGMTLGTPLFYPYGTHSGSWNRTDACQGVENNRIKAHHLGLSGKIARLLPYRLMATYAKCFGTYPVSYAGESAYQKPWGTVEETPLKQFSFGLNIEIPLMENSLVILPGFYFDCGEVLEKTFGASVGLRYRY